MLRFFRDPLMNSTYGILNLDELSRRLGKDRREVEKLVQRGRIPGRKVAGTWQFQETEITQWMEQELRKFDEAELADFEQRQTQPLDSLETILKPETVQVPLQARTRRSLLEELIEVAGRSWQVWEPAAIFKAVLQREEIMSTALPGGVAIPHPRSQLPDALGESIVTFGRTQSGIPFGAPQRELTDLFFLVLCRDSRTHLSVLARLSRLLQRPGFLNQLRLTETGGEAHDLILKTDRELTSG